FGLISGSTRRLGESGYREVRPGRLGPSARDLIALRHRTCTCVVPESSSSRIVLAPGAGRANWLALDRELGGSPRGDRVKQRGRGRPGLESSAPRPRLFKRGHGILPAIRPPRQRGAREFMAARFMHAGLPSVAVWGDSLPGERAAALADLAAGRVRAV